MGKVKEQVVEILELLEIGLDYQTIADRFGVKVEDVAQIDRDYGERPVYCGENSVLDSWKESS